MWFLYVTFMTFVNTDYAKIATLKFLAKEFAKNKYLKIDYEKIFNFIFLLISITVFSQIDNIKSGEKLSLWITLWFLNRNSNSYHQPNYL